MEGLEPGVDFEFLTQDREAVGKGHVEGSPHFLGGVAERSSARFDGCVEGGAARGAAAVGVEEDVPGVLHEDCAVEVWVLLAV